MTEPTYRCAIFRPEKVHYQVHTVCWVLVVVAHVSVGPCVATAECKMSKHVSALFCRNM
jgi:hypothetical protein